MVALSKNQSGSTYNIILTINEWNLIVYTYDRPFTTPAPHVLKLIFVVGRRRRHLTVPLPAVPTVVSGAMKYANNVSIRRVMHQKPN